MGKTAIEWTEQTWNPVTGCSKVSPGCDHCYAEKLATTKLKGSRGYPGLPWTPENAATNVVLHPQRLDQPKRWRQPSMVFVNSMSDLFHPRIPSEFIAQVFDVMENCPQHTFQVLTKRPKRMRDWTWKHRPEPLPNVWLGTSIESREYVDRAGLLREASAAIRFVSAEPLLGPLARFGRWPGLDLPGVDWLIVGGESGQGHRPIKEEWVRDLRDAALAEGTAFFFKQWGGIRAKSGGRELDGRTWDEYPRTAEMVA